jgi:putative holliday junction resolvase
VLPDEVRVELVDERLTSVAAERSLGFEGKKLDREQKKLIDQVAAVAILQDYLNTKAGAEGWLLPDDKEADIM